MVGQSIKIYTDGSCHTQLLTGAWGAIIFSAGKKEILHGVEFNTTHNRMELVAVINALKRLDRNSQDKINIYSDSQYVVNLPLRRSRLANKNFETNAGNEIQNLDLVKQFFELLDKFQIEFVKVKAHQKDGDPHNKEIDLIVRELVRTTIKNNTYARFK